MLHTERIEAEVSPPLGCIVALHGRGTQATDLMPLAEALRLPKILFVFPEAPYVVPEFAPGKAWYRWPSDEHEGLLESRAQLYELLERIQKEGVPSHRIAFLGFSQGAVMSLDVGARYPKKLAGIVGLSGYLYNPPALAKEKFSGALNAPILLAHGTYDSIVPVEHGRATYQALVKEGFSVKFLEYAMDHQIVAEEMAEIRKFLLDIFPGAE